MNSYLNSNKFIFRLIILAVYLLIGFESNSQKPTLGLLHSKPDVSDGYMLFTPERNNSVYMINNCGEKINEWTFSEKPGLTCYLLDNGTLLRTGKDSLEIRDWDNNLLWSYATTANGIKQHHDIEPLPNGNILLVVNDFYSDSVIIEEGRDPASLISNFKLDKIIELQPIGTGDANIVWEWKFIDHLIQDFDSSKLNYGVVGDHPGLIDLNFDNGGGDDFTHVNAIDYNASLDQILISTRNLSEIHIIDHSTTTAEAAGHTGGNSNRGGDILWRWGNPMVYRQGGITDRKLFLQHDPQWVKTGYADEGKISVFNNGGDTSNTFSSIHLLEPEIVGGVYTKTANRFNPIDFDWSWQGTILGRVVFDKAKSGVFSLPNGNLCFCETAIGQISEITKNGDHLWTYRNPAGNIIFNQYDSIVNGNSIFRAEKYPQDYPGFFGKDLSPKGIIENENSLSDTCIILADIEENINTELITIVNPVENGIIQFHQDMKLSAVRIVDITGRQVYSQGAFNGNVLRIDLNPAIYFLQLFSEKKIRTLKIIVN